MVPSRGSTWWPLLLPLTTLLAAFPAAGVLRYPDGSFEKRFPLHVDECGQAPWGRGNADLELASRTCLQRLREHLLEDADCNRVICDNIHTSTPVEMYSNTSDWVPFKNLCGNLREFFVKTFDLGVSLIHRSVTPQDDEQLAEAWRTLTDSCQSWYGARDDGPSYANTSREVLRRHLGEVVAHFEAMPAAQAQEQGEDAVLNVAVAVARRLQLLIENFSVTLLLNYHIAALEHTGRVEKQQNLLHDMYGDVSTVKVVFHEIPGKRWDALSFLLHRLGVAEGRVAMAEIGVEAANTSQRLLERNPMLTYVGVDPYVNNDAVYEDVLMRLSPYRAAGRFTLHRSTSLAAAGLVEDASLDLVFLDARHDGEAVMDDISAWHRKLRPGGVLSGHDFSWMFPPLAMAVYKVAFRVPERTIHLSPDGVWWFQL